MSVRYGFMTEIYGFTHSLRILQHVSLFCTLVLMMEDSSDVRRRRKARERMQRYRRRFSAQQRDERQQDETERRFARQYQWDSLRLLTVNGIGERHDAVVVRLHNKLLQIDSTTLRHNFTRQHANFPRALREACPAHAYT